MTDITFEEVNLKIYRRVTVQTVTSYVAANITIHRFLAILNPLYHSILKCD
jgi:hypothetical protein